MTIAVNEDVLDFLTGVHGDRKKADNRKKAIFDRAFELAYKDMATHTVAYINKYKKHFDGNSNKHINNKQAIRTVLKDNMKECIFGNYDLNYLKGAIKSKDSFDEWHKNSCKFFVEQMSSKSLKIEINKKQDMYEPILIRDIIEYHDKSGKISRTFTYGQAQKIINMMCKYLYIYYQCEGWIDLYDGINVFHAPLDRLVLRGAEIKGVTWSKIDNYDQNTDGYKSIQDKVSGWAKSKDYTSAFAWELAEWPF